jgi:hypothetical protein
VITVVNRSTLVTDSDVQLMTRACATQLKYHAAPAWGRLPIPVVYAASEAVAPPGSWVIGIFDDSDQAGALGWHDISSDVVFGRVFARPVLDHGGDALTKQLSVASVLSHEVLETFVDPFCNLYADWDGHRAVAVEVGDPVEADSYPVMVSGIKVTVSNFVTQRWFDNQATTGPFDHLGNVTEPFTMTKGGYLIVLAEGRVSQVFGDKHEEWRTRELKQSPLSRTARRMKIAV